MFKGGTSLKAGWVLPSLGEVVPPTSQGEGPPLEGQAQRSKGAGPLPGWLAGWHAPKTPKTHSARSGCFGVCVQQNANAMTEHRFNGVKST